MLDHIDQHLDGELDLETVSGVAAFSKFHFHRQFTATFGVSVHRYVQFARLKRASLRLASKDDDSITQIASDAFASAFRKRLGQSPSSFRKSPDWEPWLSAFGPLEKSRSKVTQIIFEPGDVTIRDAPPTPAVPADYSMDLCAGTDQPIEPNDVQIRGGAFNECLRDGCAGLSLRSVSCPTTGLSTPGKREKTDVRF